MTDQTQRLEIATVRAEIGSNITYRFNNDAIDAGGIPTESGDIKNLKQIIKSIEDKASISTAIYPTVAAGLAATAEGGMFLVASADTDEIYEVWRKVAGAAVDTGKRALSSQAAQDAVDAAQASAENSAASAVDAQAAAANAAAEFQDIFEADQNSREEEFQAFMAGTGYESVYLSYGAGVILERQTQLVQRLGELYRAANIADLPLTLNGTWTIDAPKLIAVGDASLRQSLIDGDLPLGHEQSTVGDHLNSSLLATDFGVRPGLGVDNYNAIVAFLDLAWAQKKLAIFPAGVYETSQTIEFYRGRNFQTIGVGFPTIKYTGATPGHVVSIDAGLGSSVYGILFGGFNIEGNAQTIDGVYTRAVSHSKFYEIRSWDCLQSPFRVVSGVCNEYVGLRLTSAGGRPGAPGIFPQNSLVLQSRVAGDYVAWCTFTNIKAEYAIENGILCVDATGNTFVGGTAEHCKTGIYLYPACSHNTFINMDYEGNTVNDIGINGTNNKFINNQCLSGLAINISVQSAEGTSLDGGYLRSINLQGPSKDTLMTGCSVSDNGALGITGTGTYRAIRVRKVNGSGNRTGMVEEYPTSSFTPGIPGSTTSIAVGTFTKHNNIVTGQLYIVVSSVPTAGTLRITGLPHAAISTANSYASVTIGQYLGFPSGPGARTQLTAYIAPGASSITIGACGGGLAPVTIDASTLSASAALMVSFSYMVPE